MPQNRQGSSKFSNTGMAPSGPTSPTKSGGRDGHAPASPASPASPVSPAHRTSRTSLAPTAASPIPAQRTGGLESGTRHADRSARHGSSFEARFGRVILQHGIAAIPSALFHYQGEIGLKAQHVWFISYILSHKWDEDLPYPSLSNMARYAGVTLRNIQFIKSDLCHAGMLEVTERYTGKGGRDSNAYDFSGLFAHLEELISYDNNAPNKIGADPPAPGTPGDNTYAATASTSAGQGEPDSSFVARFGRVIAGRGVAAVPRAIFTHQKALGLTPQQIWFVSYIFSFQWSTPLPYPSINKMSQHTGYSRAHLHTIKAELVAAGYLRLVHRTNDQGGQDSNAYDFSGLLDAIRSQLQPDPPLTETLARPEHEPEPESPRGRHLFSQRRGQVGAQQRNSSRLARTPYEAEQTGVYEAQHTAPHERGHIGVYESEQMPAYEVGQIPLYEGWQLRPVHAGSYTATNVRGRGTMKGRGHESEAIQKETNDKKDDSNQPALLNKVERKEPEAAAKSARKTEPLPYSPYMAAVITDFSDELGDSEHAVSNVTQALRIFGSSGLDEQTFSELLFQARKLVRTYHGRNGVSGINNKIAYFFVVLRDLVKNAVPDV